jgi:cytochrome c
VRALNRTRRPARVAAIAIAAVLWGCERPATVDDTRATRDVDARAVALIRYYGCGTCHVIPGVPSATGLVGPPLTGLKGRTYLGGAVTNTPENLARWIRNPRELAPRTAKPDVGVSETDAKLIAAYLNSR